MTRVLVGLLGLVIIVTILVSAVAGWIEWKTPS